jgi:hypothetical protein
VSAQSCDHCCHIFLVRDIILGPFIQQQQQQQQQEEEEENSWFQYQILSSTAFWRLCFLHKKIATSSLFFGCGWSWMLLCSSRFWGPVEKALDFCCG